MHRVRMTGTIAGCFALSAFAVAVVAGLAGGNATSSILARALLAMIVCYPMGLLVGLICQRVVQEHLQAQAAGASGAAGDSEAAPAEQKVQSEEESQDVIVV